MDIHSLPTWTHEEREREERVRRIRAARSQMRSHEERLEETLHLSRFVSELRQGASSDVRAG